MNDIIEKSDKYAAYGVSIVLLLTTMSMMSCSNKPNDKLKIEGKIYTISLGEINYDAETSLITIEILADGKPVPNITQYKTTTINIGGQEMKSTSSFQPVKMSLMVKGRLIPANEYISSENGIFTFEVEEAPDIIEVFTDTKQATMVKFDAKAKEIMSSKEYNLYIQEWITKNRKNMGME